MYSCILNRRHQLEVECNYEGQPLNGLKQAQDDEAKRCHQELKREDQIKHRTTSNEGRRRCGRENSKHR